MRLEEFNKSVLFDFDVIYQKVKLKITQYRKEFDQLLSKGLISEEEFEDYIERRLDGLF